MNIILNFKRKELLYDIANACYIMSDSLTSDNHSKHNIIDIAQDGNVDWITRRLDLVNAEIQHLLSSFNKETVNEGDSTDDSFGEVDAYIYKLLVPDTFLSVTHKYLSQLIHNLMVDMCISSYLSDVIGGNSLGEAQLWLSEANEIKDKIKAALTARSKRMRVSQHPFI